MTGKEAVRMAIGREWPTSRGKITRRKVMMKVTVKENRNGNDKESDREGMISHEENSKDSV